MAVQAINQTIFPSVLGKTKVFYCSRSFTSGNRTLWSFQIPRGKYFDLLPALPLNNWIMSTFDGRGIPWVYTALKLNFTKKCCQIHVCFHCWSSENHLFTGSVVSFCFRFISNSRRLCWILELKALNKRFTAQRSNRC